MRRLVAYLRARAESRIRIARLLAAAGRAPTERRIDVDGITWRGCRTTCGGLESRRRSGRRRLVSHRFSTVRMADLILVLDDGRVVEQGTHDELCRRGGLYAELFALQAAAYG
jgi:hypothetical protein